MELIERQAALDAVSSCGICIQKVVDIPTIDAEPVVRCKDCKYMGEVPLTHNGDYIVNSCGYHNSFVNKNDYCSRAERKDDGTN